MAKFEEKIRARVLRQNGESIGRIAKIVGAGKSTVSLWCQDIYLSDLQKKNLANNSRFGAVWGGTVASDNRKRERLSRVARLKTIGVKKVGILTKRELFLVGAALYWAEGGKNQRRVVFINSDAKMVLLWLRWVTECLDITRDRITCRVEINESHAGRIKEISNYWSELAEIPLSQFTKPSFKHSATKKTYKNSNDYFGSIQLTVKRGTNLNYEILGFIAGLASVVKEN